MNLARRVIRFDESVVQAIVLLRPRPRSSSVVAVARRRCIEYGIGRPTTLGLDSGGA